MSNQPLTDNGHTYALDPESPIEMRRLIDQARMITQGMGGPLAEHRHSEQFHTILDLACGSGSWVLDVASTLPESRVIGVDISRIMIDYARTQAHKQQIGNVSFEIMDIRQPLSFPENSFDLINARLLVGVLYKEVWPHLLAECRRLLKPGGMFRLTESDNAGLSTSPSRETLMALTMTLMHQAGYGFSPEGRTFGMTPVLAPLLRKAGFVEIESQAHSIRFSLFDETYSDICDNTRAGMLQMQPLLIKAGLITEEVFDQLYQQMEIEMQSADFSGTWSFLTVWGQNPQ